MCDNNYITQLSEYDKYQMLKEAQTIEFVNKISDYERTLNILNSVVDISLYLNKFKYKDNIYDLANDMIIGLMGVAFSSIILIKENKPFIVASNKYNVGDSYEILKSNSRILTIEIKNNNIISGYLEVEYPPSMEPYNHCNNYLQLIASQISLIIENRELYSQLTNQANTDALCKCYNRHFFYNNIYTLTANSNCYGFIYADLDLFKKINDTYGHKSGDIVLKEFCHILKNNISSLDFVTRLGGEEFLIYISDVKNSDLAFKKADELRKLIQNTIITCGDTDVHVTASFGVAIYGIHGKTVDNLIVAADRNLYISKSKGRNLVTI